MILVDEITNHGSKGDWCHMATDSDDLEELHHFAQSIGLKRSWFQPHSVLPHYDLRPTKRRLAIHRGATPVGGIELLKRCAPKYKNRP